MKKILILFFIILSLPILCKDVDMEQLIYQNDIVHIKGEKEPFSGISRDYFNNGNILEEAKFKNGLKEGITKKYYRDGSIKEKKEYKNGQLNGVREVYYGNEKLWIYQEWKDGELNGTSKNYYENGNLSSEGFDINGKIDGFLKFYNEDGSLSSESSYKMGIATGPTRVYFNNGQLLSEVNYMNDEKEGMYKEYYEDGSIRVIGQYKIGEKDGKWIRYNQRGTVLDEKIYDANEKIREKNEKKKKQIPPSVVLEYNSKNSKYYLKYEKKPYTGEEKVYYDNGNINSLSTYKDGIKIHSCWYDYFVNEQKSREDITNGNISERKMYNEKGIVTHHFIQNIKEDTGEDRYYSEDGQLKNVERYVVLTHGIRKAEGVQESYYNNGNLEVKAEIKNGIHNGKYEDYYENGKLYRKGQMKNGEKIGVWEIYSENGKLKEKRNY